jgi:glutamate racemase
MTTLHRLPAGPIGILDSGVGGLSIFRALHAELPHDSIVYIADQAHLPYGPRPLDEIRAFVHTISGFLLEQGVKIIVVACNAASAAGLYYLRSTYPDVLFVGMEPAVKPAARNTRSGVISVLTTAATAEGALYASVVKRFASAVKVHTLICPALVQAVERNATSLADLRPIFDDVLAPALQDGADQIVLGCTHFPFAAEAIQQYAGPDVTIVDPSPAVARQTRHLLAEHDLLAPSTAPAAPRFYTTGSAAQFSHVASSLLKTPVTARALHWTADNHLHLPEITQ